MSDEDPKAKVLPSPGGAGQPRGEATPLLAPAPLSPDPQAQPPAAPALPSNPDRYSPILANPKGSFYANELARPPELAQTPETTSGEHYRDGGKPLPEPLELPIVMGNPKGSRYVGPGSGRRGRVVLLLVAALALAAAAYAFVRAG